MKVTREQAITTLRNHALGKTDHRYMGLCPDARVEGVTTRDPRCRVCTAIDAVMQPAASADGSGPR